jgi:hypothetical protein
MWYNTLMINYDVGRIDTKTAKAYIHEHHYSRGSHNGPSPCYGLFDGAELIGVCMFATPCSENVRSSIYGKSRKNEVIELHRFHILDVTPKNAESWFLSRCLSLLGNDRPEKTAVVSFSDETAGHNGTIYRACNALYYGRSARARFYLDETGRLRHPRQNGHNITVKEAVEMSWTPTWREGKYRYLFLLGSGPKKKLLKKELLIETLPYP